MPWVATNRTRSVSRKKASSLAEQCLLIICRGLVFKMAVHVVCVGGGWSMTSFELFSYIFLFFVEIQACFHLVGVMFMEI